MALKMLKISHFQYTERIHSLIVTMVTSEMLQPNAIRYLFASVHD